MAADISTIASGTWPEGPSSARAFATGNEVVRLTDLPSEGSAARPVATQRPVTSTEIGGSSRGHAFRLEAAVASRAASTTPVPSVRGVVDEIEGGHARVNLSYSGRDNPFLFDLHELEAAGAAYPGALFEVVVGPAFQYKIVHLEEEEEAARRAALPPDLSFLDK